MKYSIQLFLLVAIWAVLVTGTSLYGAAWYGGVDDNWYNSANYNTLALPDMSTTLELASAIDAPPTKRNCVIDGGTANSLNILLWADSANNTSKLTVTNGAILTVGNQLGVGSNNTNASAGVYINGGSKVTVGTIILGRSYSGGYMGLSTLDISGAGTELIVTAETLIGFSTPAPSHVVVRDGALLKHNGGGGSFFLNYWSTGTNDGVLDVAGGEVQIKGDRSWQVPGWTQNGWLISYGGQGSVSCYYDAATNYTRITGQMVPEPTSAILLITGFMAIFRKTRASAQKK